MNNFKSLIEKLAHIIGYTGDIEELYKKLAIICYLNATDQLIESLPKENRESVRKKISDISDPKQFQEVVSKYFNQQQFNDALQKASETIFIEYLETIKESLSDEQVNKLREFSISLKPQTKQ